MTHIIDDDEPASRRRIDMGYQAARQAFEKAFQVQTRPDLSTEAG